MKKVKQIGIFDLKKSVQKNLYEISRRKPKTRDKCRYVNHEHHHHVPSYSELKQANIPVQIIKRPPQPVNLKGEMLKVNESGLLTFNN